MEELEKIEWAKTYMDKLANGINPIDDTIAPDEDIINNVRLSRCFFFVSDVLRQVIENGGTKPAIKKAKKVPLTVPFEKRSQFAYSEKPIPASEIAKRVNILVDAENMRKLTYSNILTWLTEIGMMELAVTTEGKSTMRPTQIGMASGIPVDERTGRRGSYQVVVYNSEAQHFILDNLDAILAVVNKQA